MSVIIIGKLHGVHPELEAKLKARGIKNSEELLRECRLRGGVEALADYLGADPNTIKQLVYRADLARIRGIGEAYTGLLEAAGIRSVQDLADRSPEDLRSQFTRINNERKLVGRVPALAMVNGWVNKARRLPATLK